jgi:hypothetical protein
MGIKVSIRSLLATPTALRVGKLPGGSSNALSIPQARAATTSNISLSGLQTIDGVALANAASSKNILIADGAGNERLRVDSSGNILKARLEKLEKAMSNR